MSPNLSELKNGIQNILGGVILSLIFFSCQDNSLRSEITSEKNIPDSSFFVSRATDDTVYTNVPFKLEGKWKDTAEYKPKRGQFGNSSFRIVESPKYNYIFDSLSHKAFPVYLDSAKTVTIGSDTFDIPDKVKYIPEIIPLRSSEPIVSQPLRRKENARIDVQYLTSESGLPSSYISSLLFASDGIMWIGTVKGLCRYDGNNITTYKSENGLPDEVITELIEDSDGNIWIGTKYGGVAKYDGKNLTVFNKENGLHSNDIMTIREDSMGNIWIAMWGGGVAKFDGEFIESIDRENGLLESRVMTLTVDENDLVWIGTNGKGLYSYDGKELKNYNERKAGFKTGYLLSLFRDSKERLWLGNWENICYLHNDSIYFVQMSSPMKGFQSSAFLEDSKGNIWMSSMTSGVFRYDGCSLMTITELGGLSSNEVSDICEDAAGNIWFATSGGGLCRYNPNSFDYFDESAGLSSKIVNRITEMKDGRVAFATNSGLVLFDDTSFHKIYIRDSEMPHGGRIYDAFQRANGDFWFTQLNNAIYKISNDSIQQLGRNQGVHDHNITAFAERKNGELWMGSFNVGMAKMDQKGFTVFNAASGFHNFVINDLFVDSKDNLWVASDGEGITIYDGIWFKHLTEHEGLLNNHVNSFYEDRFGTIWVLTKGGINIIRGTDPECFSNPEVLPDKDVVSMIQDKDGNYWIFTSNGLLYLKLKENVNPTQWNLADYDTKLFTQFDGLMGMDFIPRSVFIDSKNRIWFGTGKGLMMKNLSSFDLSPKIPSISLETIKLNGHFIDYQNFSDTVQNLDFLDFDRVVSGIGEPQKFENIPTSLVLPPDVNHLTFLFSAQGWFSDKILFTYRLSGMDENWSVPSKNAWAEYRNLSYGDYTFQLKAIGESNVESEMLEYEFTILPPWYHTWWARIVFLICIILCVRLVVRLRTRQLQLKQIELENKVKERTAQLDVKNKELVSQNTIIEEQKIEVEKRKEEIEKQHTLLEETHKEIKDSINYAKRIQEAILPTNETVSNYIPDNFILYKPKDVVAGDFYWIQKVAGGVLFSASDCTGHGVPGAMVSVVCYNALNRSVREFGETSPEKILDKTREIVLETFQQSTAQVNDGMDAGLIFLSDPDKNGERELLFSGANNSVSVVRDGQMFEIDGDKQPVGNYMEAKPFTLKSFSIKTGDIIYLFTDGYADQFGGPKGKKLKSKALKELLISFSKESLTVQKEKLLYYLEEWKGDLEQLDDISVFGFKV